MSNGKLTVAVALGMLLAMGCSGSGDTDHVPSVGDAGDTGGTEGSTAGTGGSDATAGAGEAGATGGVGGAGGTGGAGGSDGPSDGGTTDPGGDATVDPPGPTGAEAFCSEYEDACGYGPERFTSTMNCQTTYESFSDARKTCVVGALAQVDSTISAHCDSAAGGAPCE